MGRLKKENGWEGWWRRIDGKVEEGEWMGRKINVYVNCNESLMINPIYLIYFQFLINIISKGQISKYCLIFWRNVLNSPLYWYVGRNVKRMYVFNTGWNFFLKSGYFSVFVSGIYQLPPPHPPPNQLCILQKENYSLDLKGN